MIHLIQKVVPVEDHEVSTLLHAFAYFFCLLAGYYLLRPLRDEMGIQGGVEHLQWLFTGTFVATLAAVPIYGAIVSRFPRRQFLPWIYHFFAFNILLFWIFFQTGQHPIWTARVFFVWMSVFNLFVVSVFWSFMADLFSKKQAKRLYGFIAAGGTAGAICGPLFTLSLVKVIGPVQLLLCSVLLLEAAVLCIRRLSMRQPGTSRQDAQQEENTLGGGWWAGFLLVLRSWYLGGICTFMLLFTTCSTFLYFAQARIVADSFADSASRTAMFALIDFLVNVLTLTLQIFATGRLLRRYSLAMMLALLPLVMGAGFLVLGAFPVLVVVVTFQVLRRALNYAISRPARETLFTIVTREEKYKAKNVIDTAVYRGGDAVSSWVFAGLHAAGLSLPMILLLGVPAALAWGANGFVLGRKFDKM